MKLPIIPIALGAMFAASTSVAQSSPDHTLTVLAAGVASAPADKVSLQFTVSSQDPTATGLFVKQSDIVSRLKKALAAGGVTADEVSEEPFRLLPNMEYGQAGTRIIGYRLDTPLDVQLDNVKDLPRVIDLATANGAGSVTVGNFGLSGGRSLHEEAMHSAIANARKEAAAIAKDMGKTVGDIISISETEDAGKAAASQGGEEEERREKKRGEQQQPNTLSEKAELKVVFELK